MLTHIPIYRDMLTQYTAKAFKMKDSMLNTEVSIYRNAKDTSSPHTVPLLAWLKSKQHLPLQEKIRAAKDKAERSRLKSLMPMITPSGVFSQRNQDSLVSHSGFIAIDIDRAAANEFITNWGDLPNLLTQLKNIAYFGRSVGGEGYWALVPIAYPDKHKAHFKALQQAFSRLGIELDPAPSNVASCRFYAHDPEGYFNHHATPFTGILEEESPKPAPAPAPTGDNGWLLDWILKEMRNVPLGERHATRLKLGRLAGGYIAGGLLPHDAGETLVSAYINDYGSNAQRKEIKAIRDGIKNGMQSPIFEISDLKPVTRFSPRRAGIPQPKDIMPPRPRKWPKTEVLRRGGEVWCVEINEHGYPAIWG